MNKNLGEGFTWRKLRHFLANSSGNVVRAAAGCELLRVRAAPVVTLKNRVRAAAVVRHAVWCELRIFLANSS